MSLWGFGNERRTTKPGRQRTGCSPTAIGPPNSTETAPPPDPAETYPPRTVETAPPHPAEASLASPAAGNTGAETTRRSSNSRQFTRIWRRARVRVLAVIGAAIVGIAFGHVVAGNDYRIQIFLSTTVGAGLFIVFSGLATEVNGNRQSRSR
jgi:hypothetical protein